MKAITSGTVDSTTTVAIISAVAIVGTIFISAGIYTHNQYRKRPKLAYIIPTDVDDIPVYAVQDITSKDSHVSGTSNNNFLTTTITTTTTTTTTIVISGGSSSCSNNSENLHIKGSSSSSNLKDKSMYI